MLFRLNLFFLFIIVGCKGVKNSKINGAFITHKYNLKDLNNIEDISNSLVDIEKIRNTYFIDIDSNEVVIYSKYIESNQIKVKFCKVDKILNFDNDIKVIRKIMKKSKVSLKTFYYAIKTEFLDGSALWKMAF